MKFVKVKAEVDIAPALCFNRKILLRSKISSFKYFQLTYEQNIYCILTYNPDLRLKVKA